MTDIHICRSGPTEEIRRDPDGVRWCFKCRKRREFIYTVTAEIEPSYYDPTPAIRCGVCDTYNGDLGFGRTREWE